MSPLAVCFLLPESWDYDPDFPGEMSQTAGQSGAIISQVFCVCFPSKQNQSSKEATAIPACFAVIRHAEK